MEGTLLPGIYKGCNEYAVPKPRQSTNTPNRTNKAQERTVYTLRKH